MWSRHSANPASEYPIVGSLCEADGTKESAVVSTKRKTRLHADIGQVDHRGSSGNVGMRASGPELGVGGGLRRFPKMTEARTLGARSLIRRDGRGCGRSRTGMAARSESISSWPRQSPPMLRRMGGRCRVLSSCGSTLRSPCTSGMVPLLYLGRKTTSQIVQGARV